MILDEMHFEYGEFVSRTYGLIFAHMDTSNFMPIAGTIDTYSLFNKRDSSRYIIGNNYENFPLSMEVEIITDNFQALKQKDRRAVEKALFNKPNYRKLYIDLTDDIFGDTYEFVEGIQKRLYFKCRFLNPERIEDGRGLVVGYKCTMECDSGYMEQETVEKTFDLTGSHSNTTNITLNVDTDSSEYIYPKVRITMGSSGGNVTIINHSDDSNRETSFNGVGRNATIIMNGRVNSISGEYYSIFSKQNFIRLLDGSNSIGIIGNVSSISFEWNNKRFM